MAGSSVLLVLLDGEALELRRLLADRRLCRKPLHRTCPVKAVADAAMLQDIARVVRPRDRAAMAQHDDVLAYRKGGIGNGVDFANAVGQRFGGSSADAAAGGDAHMRDDDVRT